MTDIKLTRKRSSILIFVGVCFFLGSVYLKVYFQSRQEFQIAETHLSRGELRLAIRHYAYVVRWYTPGNRYVNVAIQRIKKLGEHAYKNGNWALALFAYQQLRNGISSTRHLFQPHSKVLEHCHERLSRLLSLVSGKVPFDADNDVPLKKSLLKMLRKEHPTPSPWLSFAAALSFVLWLVSCGYILATWHHTPTRDRLYSMISSVGLALLWLLFLSVA
ncbi:MAG TPA: hypothetical protein DCE42_06675 [Myxococcales bacterium]|nr:hypothetical protein [Deltaproteobacteria bacterium]MBU47699.1 hypothetical protein [Deltaproteobacteria bacterium]HAA54421.1 hypothetical protein [Myxococcales bacterium]